MTDLNNVFEDDKADATKPAEVAATDETKGAETEAEEVKGEDNAKTPDAKDEDDGQPVPKKALLDERRKRQALEAENAELKKNKEPEEQTSDIGTILLKERINNSRELMMELKPDYEEVETVFIDMTKENPSLIAEMNASRNPAKFAYTKAKEHLEYQEFKKSKEDPEYKEFLEFKKSKAEKAAEPEETPDDKRKKSAVKVPDLTKVASKGKNSEQPASKPGLDDALKDAPF